MRATFALLVLLAASCAPSTGSAQQAEVYSCLGDWFGARVAAVADLREQGSTQWSATFDAALIGREAAPGRAAAEADAAAKPFRDRAEAMMEEAQAIVRKCLADQIASLSNALDVSVDVLVDSVSGSITNPARRELAGGGANFLYAYHKRLIDELEQMLTVNEATVERPGASDFRDATRGRASGPGASMGSSGAAPGASRPGEALEPSPLTSSATAALFDGENKFLSSEQLQALTSPPATASTGSSGSKSAGAGVLDSGNCAELKAQAESGATSTIPSEFCAGRRATLRKLDLSLTYLESCPPSDNRTAVQTTVSQLRQARVAIKGQLASVCR